ncbi:hypothetical protein LTR10_019112 [Elasticomyces elasticus]|uniref:LYC1 C-terminal domain-containing protein n=1 Tax=Exophiala sideris TaxID=1016849 RepID=A0ABR0JHW8_9EURO|nr:hypothetical protein LTR10_019112 [Elasticomyces elasticus]KAK5033480.1 hypothetical protein LTS07_003784 [Exophiala sideris]KAK5042025.1 hypothetical protein LTR13_001831 [Exophiala sideris]KAK5064024.1 hypothetical protein LTR69_003792 [Exophiala sideris]KAK5185293.1 hypothetical protein LTR44_002282 [Eurotiomycetes sp. CCFEE 6388]
MSASTTHANDVLTTSKPSALDEHFLPSTQSPDLKVEPATPLEYLQTTHLNAEEWKGPLDLQQYLEREEVLQQTDLTKDGRITGWILTSDAIPCNPNGTRPIFASCETIQVCAYVAHKGYIQNVQAHGIASVFTRSEYRGKGYAARMMVELGKRLESWQKLEDLSNAFSVLYSDIGPKFYARHGWKVFPSTHIHLALLGQNDYDRAKGELPSVEELAMSDLHDIPTVRYVEQRLQEQSTARPNTTFVAIRPDLEHFGWHIARDEFQCQLLGKGHPSVKGAIHRETGLALIWCRVFAASEQDWQLHILHTVIPPSIQNSADAQAAMAALLLRAQLEASRWDMVAGVEVWDPSELTIAAAQKLKAQEQDKVDVITRDKEHLCSLRWNKHEDEDVTWLANEKYAWC